MDISSRLEQEAINAAIKADWSKAIDLNKEIAKKDKKNIDALLRLGFAYLQEGKILSSKKTYRQALRLQPGNCVANDNLEKIKILQTKKIKKTNGGKLDPYLFLDIPGKTKTVTLVNCGQKAILANLMIGQELNIAVRKRKVEVRTLEKEYIGCLPDDISKRLTIFIKAGSDFHCYVKEATIKHTTVFLKEKKKGKRVQKYASFPINIQANLHNLSIGEEIEGKEEEFEELSENDLEQLAESLNEEKEYLPYQSEEKDDDQDE